MRPRTALSLALAACTAFAPTAAAVIDLPLVPTTRLVVGAEEGELDAVESALRLLGVTVRRTDAELEVAMVETADPAGLVSALAGAVGVAFVEMDDRVGATGVDWNGIDWNGVDWNGEASEGGAPARWGLEAVRAPEAWATSTGTRAASICVLDTGVDASHPALAPNVARRADGSYGRNVLAPGSPPVDDVGHGTHVAGVAAAAVSATGISGVANASIVPVKVVDAAGNGRESDLASGLAWCARERVDVALIALDASEASPTLDRALAYAARHDVLVVASAGNDGCEGCVAEPAASALALAVAATGPEGGTAAFSARGPEVDLAAPGVDVAGPLPGGRVGRASGTSQAAAFVAGAAALVADEHPDLDAAALRAILLATAADADAAGPDVATGAGVVDVAAALDAAALDGTL